MFARYVDVLCRKKVAVAFGLLFTLTGLARAQSAKVPDSDPTPGDGLVFQYGPRYCQIVFGSEGKDPLWLIMDAVLEKETSPSLRGWRLKGWLYVDKNRNGRFTDPGEKISVNDMSARVNPNFNQVEFASPDGKKTYRLLVLVAKEGPMLSVFSRSTGRDYFCGEDDRGQPLAFGKCAKTAPRVHVDGFLQLHVYSLKANEANGDVKLMATIGTPGQKAFTRLAHFDISPIMSKVQPKAVIEFADKTRTEIVLARPLKGTVRDDNWFMGTFAAAAANAGGQATIHLEIRTGTRFDGVIGDSTTNVTLPKK